MNRLREAMIGAAALAVLVTAGCDDSQEECFLSGESCDWYGGGQPGEGLAEGGEIRHERVYQAGHPAQAWIQLYQYKGPGVLYNAPFPAAAAEGRGALGFCVDERDPTLATWPFKPILDATSPLPTFLELPTTELHGTGIDGVLSITKTDPPNKIGNSTYRAYDFTYGGGVPGTANGGFNASLSPDVAEPGGAYTLDIDQGLMEYQLPADYEPPLYIGGAETVTIAHGRDLVLDWDAPPNDHGESGMEMTRKTYKSYVLFVDPTAAFPPQFLCLPEADGVQTINRAVIEQLPPSGQIIHTVYTHYFEAQKADGENRRFDLVGSIVNISNYVIE